MDKMEWVKKFPETEGMYWFYGYRYGKESCGYKNEKEICLVKVSKISNGIMLSTDGQIMYESEPEEYFFKKATLPELPEDTE